MGKITLAGIKSEIAKSGANKGKILYFKEGVQYRVRFLTDFEDGIEITFHDNFKLEKNYPCQEIFGRDCPGCEDSELRTRSKYCWAVYDYESKEVRLLLEAVNQCTCVGALSAYYETHGTLTDRDYIIKQLGGGTSKQFTVIGQEKRIFRNSKARPLTEKAMLKIIDKAFPCADVAGEEEEEETETKIPEWNEKMKPSQLYKICQAREIEVQPKQPKAYYIEKLEQDDEERLFAQENEEEDEWGNELEEEKPDYTKMKPFDLFKLCKEKGITCEAKKPQKYYIDLLEAQDEDEWSEEEEDEWGNDDFMNIPDGIDEELPFN